MSEITCIKKRFDLLVAIEDERVRRLLVAAEAECLGYGGISVVSRETGVSRRAIAEGIKELKQPGNLPRGRVRRKGAGRKKTTEKDPMLIGDLELLIEPATCGDPESPLKWTCKSVRKLTEELQKVDHRTNRREGTSHPDRNTQFERINFKAKAYLDEKQPVISVDTKKKELVGGFKDSGRELRPKGKPEEVLVHDARTWVSVGIDHDTSAFVVETIRRWWYSMGQVVYPNATKLLITADSGGSNGSRVKLWKLELQKLADETRLEISVCHLPPGTSKWTKSSTGSSLSSARTGEESLS